MYDGYFPYGYSLNNRTSSNFSFEGATLSSMKLVATFFGGLPAREVGAGDIVGLVVGS